MRSRAVSSADLKTNLSAHLARVRSGEEIVIRDQHAPIAKIVPLAVTEDVSTDEIALAAEGKVRLPKIWIGVLSAYLPALRSRVSWATSVHRLWVPAAIFLVGCGGWHPGPIEDEPQACYEEIGQPSDPDAELIASAPAMTGVAVDDNGIYWSTTRQVFAADKETFTPILLADDQEPISLALHKGYLYWTNGPVNRQVNRVRTDGLGFEVLVAGVAADGNITVTDSPGEGADHALVYWVEPSTGLVQSIPVGPDGPNGVVQVIASKEDRPTWVAANDASVVWGARNSGDVRMADLNSGAVETVASDSDPSGFAFDDDFVYWGSHGTGSIRRLSKDGNGAVGTLASHQSGPDELTVDATHVYWTAVFNCRVMGVAKTGGEPEVIADRQPDADEIAVDDAHVYWTNFLPGSVLRAPR